ncbi:FkbM family methyltransferase [Agrobacterium rhizogenes]|nr:FkbM family methyltransferase [Rhizobium rhizogenes]NTJ77811.1 FkbM family methyltransferase [Rhizobium rhizogenes]
MESFTSFAQNFEDVMLWRALGHVVNGCYIDVGAQHPVIDSVSKAFYDRGWRGVHVEPVPQYADLLRAERPDETVLQIALGAEAGSLELNIFPDTGLSTAVDVYARSHRELHGFEGSKLQVPVLPLRTALAFLNNKPVHWLKVDVEGLEEAVLQGWDPAAIEPWIIVIEATVPMSQEVHFATADRILLEAGYKFVYFDGLNRFYVSPQHPELVPAFEAPPNVFDHVQFSENSAWCELASSKLRASLDEQGHQLTEALEHLVKVQEVADARISKAERSALEMEARCAAAEALNREAERLSLLAEGRVSRTDEHTKTQERAIYLEAKLASLEAQLVAKSKQLQDMQRSTSWRISAPVRIVGRPVHRISSAIRENRITSGIKRRIKTLISLAAHFIRQHPYVKRLAVAVLNTSPALRSRIIGILIALPVNSAQPHIAGRASPLAPSSDWRPLTFNDLPVEARRIYLDLRAATEA